jgi:C-terminal processing protease CtpA/Prc
MIFRILTPFLLLAQLSLTAIELPSVSMSSEAMVYLEEAIGFMEKNSVKRGQIDWNHFRRQVHERAKGAITPAQTYGAIQYGISLLGDRHSFFLSASQIASLFEGVDSSINGIRGELIGSQIGYVSLSRYISQSEEARRAYANKVQDIIRGLDEGGLQRWIVDLRSNSGGNMWPMIVGIGPLLGDGHAGAFTFEKSFELKWYYEKGAARAGEEIGCSIDPYYQLKDSSPYVAILIGPSTASSGEAVAISFSGMDRARTFGQPTMGLTTANHYFRLPDGAGLLIAASYFSDRLGQVYNEGVTPQTLAFGSDDIAMKSAIEWLLAQP